MEKSYLFQHNDASAHSAMSIWEFLVKNDMALAERSPYSLDLAPDFFRFPKLKGLMKEHAFVT